MDCSIFSASKLSFLLGSLLFVISSFLCLNVVSGTATRFHYGHHCDSVVHESKPGDEEFNVSPFSGRQNGYYNGGDKVLNNSGSHDPYYPPESKMLVFETHHVYATDVEDVFKVEGSLIFQTSYHYEQSFSSDRSIIYSSSDSSKRGVLDFDFQGFWSRTTGKLCMVGSSYTYSNEGKLLHLAAVLKFNNLKKSSDISTLVTGTMDSLYPTDDQNYFDQISLLMFPQVSYIYTKVSRQFSQGCPGGTDVQPESSLSLSRTRTICDMFLGGGSAFELEYASGCDPSKSCNPFGDGIGYLPQTMSLSVIQCSEEKLSLRFLIEFSNNSYLGYYRSSNLSNSLVGEGSWDSTKNRLCIIACRIFDASGSFEKSRVGDCTTRLSLRFPAILSIRNTSTVVGEIWSVKPRNDPGFFDRIVFRNTDRYGGRIQLQGLKYEYTERNRVKESCRLDKNPRTRNSRGQYPDGYSGDMGFSMSIIKGSEGRFGWGSSDPLAVGDKPHQRFPYLIQSSSSMPKNPALESNGTSLLNISYKMSFTVPSLNLDSGLNPFNQSSNGNQEIRISAEGVYDTETGSLCMVGCRHLRSYNESFLNHSVDCKTRVNIYFPPLNSDRRSKIKGSIESMRKTTDHLYFMPVEFTGRAHYGSWVAESNKRMDFEMIMSVISNTLAIVFVAFQIFHVRKHRSPSVSLLVLVILALGHLIPLVLNLEAVFVQDIERSVLIRGGTWLEMNEVIIRVITMVAFLLQIRLLMLSWTARSSNVNKKALSAAEKRGLYVCLPVYISGAMIAFAKTRKNQGGIGRYSSNYIDQIILGGSRAYAGLILDAFLFPQIIFNMFHNSKQQALSRFFYIGITLVRVVPHGYDLYRANNYLNIDDSYIFADHAADYYSTAWDFIILLLGLLFAAIIYFQQRLGGRWFFPKRFHESVIYEEIPVDSEEQLPMKL